MRILSNEDISGFPVSREGFTINPSAIEKARETLGVKLPVKIKVTSGNNRVGSHRQFLGIHRITVSQKQSLVEINKTLWHELKHAADSEQWYDAYKESKVSYRSFVSEKKAVEVEKTFGNTEWLVS